MDVLHAENPDFSTPRIQFTFGANIASRKGEDPTISISSVIQRGCAIQLGIAGTEVNVEEPSPITQTTQSDVDISEPIAAMANTTLLLEAAPSNALNNATEIESFVPTSPSLTTDDTDDVSYVSPIYLPWTETLNIAIDASYSPMPRLRSTHLTGETNSTYGSLFNYNFLLRFHFRELRY